MAQSEFAAFQDELDSRNRVLELARNRAKLLEDLRQMAETERRLRAGGSQRRAGSEQRDDSLRRQWPVHAGDLPTISSEFQKQFHHPLPISALGQTLVHQSMGLDHRNRVDVALNPDQPEGVWLRRLLERLHVPYLAFRNAVAGAATAPHIHIGTESTRLKLSIVINGRPRRLIEEERLSQAGRRMRIELNNAAFSSRIRCAMSGSGSVDQLPRSWLPPSRMPSCRGNI